MGRGIEEYLSERGALKNFEAEVHNGVVLVGFALALAAFYLENRG